METSNQQQSLQQCEQQQQQQQSIHIQIPHHSSISQLELFEFGEIKEKLKRYQELLKAKDEQIASLQCENQIMKTEIAQLRMKLDGYRKEHRIVSNPQQQHSQQQQQHCSMFQIEVQNETTEESTHNLTATAATNCQLLSPKVAFDYCKSLDCTFDCDQNVSNQTQSMIRTYPRRSAFLDKSKPHKKKRVLFPPFSELQTVITCLNSPCETSPTHSSSSSFLSERTNLSIDCSDVDITIKKRYPTSPYPLTKETTASNNSSLSCSSSTSSSFQSKSLAASPHPSKATLSSLNSLKSPPNKVRRIPLQPLHRTSQQQQQQQQHQHQYQHQHQSLKMRNSQTHNVSSLSSLPNGKCSSIPLHQGAKRVQITRTPSKPQRARIKPKSTPLNCSF